MRVLVMVLAMSGCGRIGFDDRASSDATGPGDGVIPSCTTWAPFTTPTRLAELSSSATDWAPSVSRDGRRMVFSSNRAGTQDLYVTTRASTTDVWGAPALLAGFGTSSVEEDDPSVTTDELEMYYGKNSLRSANRPSPGADFMPAGVLVPVGTFSLVQGAELSSDDLALYFSAGNPALKLFVMTRASRAAAFGSYDEVAINSTDDLGYPTLSADQRELIVSKALTSPSDRDLFLARRATAGDAFPAPSAIPELASASEDWDPELSADGATLWFASTRAPAAGIDIFVTTRTCLD